MAQIGKLADGHINHTVDNRDLYRHLGVDVYRDYEIEDVMALGEKMAEREVRAELATLDKLCRRQRIGNDKIEYSVRCPWL